jgi:hypothetical protein
MRYIYDDGLIDMVYCHKHQKFLEDNSGQVSSYMLYEKLSDQEAYVPRTRSPHYLIVTFILIVASSLFVSKVFQEESVNFPSEKDLSPQMDLATNTNPFGIPFSEDRPPLLRDTFLLPGNPVLQRTTPSFNKSWENAKR